MLVTMTHFLFFMCKILFHLFGENNYNRYICGVITNQDL